MSTIVFGDSFVGPFSLIEDNNLSIFKFKGATMKGLGKQDNPNRHKIVEIVNNINRNVKRNVYHNACLIFNFGQVDLHFSYYYRKYVQDKNFMMDSIAKKYIEFISNLNCNNCNKIVLAIYPSPINDENIFKVLLAYGILSKNQISNISEEEKKRVSDFHLDLICIENLIKFLKNTVKVIIYILLTLKMNY